MEHWLRTDELHEAVLALQMTCEQVSRVRSDPHHWKWVILGLHNALQSFMVLALRGTNGLNVLTKERASQWMAAYKRGDSKYPELRLDSFLNLYDKIKSDRMEMSVDSQALKPSSTQDQSIKTLNRLRNEFIHFVPQGWSLELHGLPRIADDCLDVISFLAFECGNVIWHDPKLEFQTRSLIKKTKRQVRLIEKAYSG